MGVTNEAGEFYTSELVGLLEAIWGEGWLSPGGPGEVDRLIGDVPFEGKSVLDIGCGAAGADCHLVEKHGARYVTGIDVEDSVLATARARVARRGLGDRIGLVKVAAGPLPFPPASFDIVFSKDSIVHIPDKHALMKEVFRVLKPRGRFVASDWLIGHDGPPSAAMKTYIEAEGLDFGMASPKRYRSALAAAGFDDIEIVNRNPWYRDAARLELERMTGDLYRPSVEAFGKDFVDRNVVVWTSMLAVLETGEHCPHHLKGTRP